MPTHRRPAWLTRTRERIIWATALGIALAIGGNYAYAAITASTVDCDAVTSTPNPDGTVTVPLRCRIAAAPAPTGSASPTPSPSSSPSTSPSPLPSPSPTATQTPSSSPTPSPSTSSPSPTGSASPTPSPSPSTSTTGPQRNCLANPGACGYPDALSTGPTAPLTTSSRTTYATVGETIVNTQINGCVEIRAAGVTFRNVIFNASGCFWAIRNFAAGTVLEDVEITCANQPGSNGFSNAGSSTGSASLRRADIHNCENGLNVPGNTTVVDSWIHDLYDGGTAHTDGAQFNQGAANIRFEHNTIDARGNTTSAIIMWDEDPPLNANVIITGNLMAGGAYTLYCSRQGPVTNIRITNNRFGPYTYGSSNGCVGNHVTEWSGNVTDSTGAVLAAA